MSIEAITWVLRNSKSTLGARLVLIAIADHAHPDGSKSFPAVATIARMARMSERQVTRCFQELQEIGEIEQTGTTQKGVKVWGVKLSPDFLNDGSKDGSGDISDIETVADVTPSRQIVTPNVCPECGVKVKGKTVAEHLADVHLVDVVELAAKSLSAAERAEASRS